MNLSHSRKRHLESVLLDDEREQNNKKPKEGEEENYSNLIDIGCKCSRLQLCRNLRCITCFQRSFASHAKSKYFHPNKSNNQIPRQLARVSNKKFFFFCEDCHHEFESTISNITNGGNWCPFCASKQLCDHSNCDFCLKKSFASNKRSVCFDVEKNNISPRQVLKSSNKKFWFACNICHHDFQTDLAKITNKKRWCPFCAHQKLCDGVDCIECHEKSFASHPKSKFLYSDKNQNINQRQSFRCSAKKYSFRCRDCRHIFESRLSHITKQSRWCPFCSNQRLCATETCGICFSKSFASHEKSQYFNEIKNNNIQPRQLFQSSPKKYCFTCVDCTRDFSARLTHITRMNSWCPFCKKKTEALLFDYLQTTSSLGVYTRGKEVCMVFPFVF